MLNHLSGVGSVDCVRGLAFREPEFFGEEKDGRPRVIAVMRPDQPDVLRLPGGKVEPGETPEEAMVREFGEEVKDRMPFEVRNVPVSSKFYIPQEREGRYFKLWPYMVFRNNAMGLVGSLFQKNNNGTSIPHHLREAPLYASVDDPRFWPSHRVLLALLLPRFGHPPPPLCSSEEEEMLGFLKFQIELNVPSELLDRVAA